MIEIVFNSREEYRRFTAEAQKRMRIRGWDNSGLAKHIRRPASSIRNFFSEKSKPSRFLAAEIAKALDMERRDWR